MKSDPRTRLGLCNQESQEAFFEERRKKVKADREQGALKERPSPVRPLLLVPRVSSSHPGEAVVYKRHIVLESGKHQLLFLPVPRPKGFASGARIDNWVRWLNRLIRKEEGEYASLWTNWQFPDPAKDFAGSTLCIDWDFRKDPLECLRHTICTHYQDDEFQLHYKNLGSGTYVPLVTTANLRSGIKAEPQSRRIHG